MAKLCSVGLCCNSSVNSKCTVFTFPDEQRTPNNNITTITHYICFPHKEPGCSVTRSYREGSVQLLLFLYASYPIYISSVPVPTPVPHMNIS